MRYDLAIFDLDGTLADSFPFFLRVYNELARLHGFHEVAPGHVEAMRELSTRELMARAERNRLRRTMKAIGVAPERTIYVGDTTADADAAHAAGAHFGAVSWGYGTAATLAKYRPAMQFTAVDDLLQISGRP